MVRPRSCFVVLVMICGLVLPTFASLPTVKIESLYNGAAWAMRLRLGTPPVEYGMYIDTGSSDLVVTKTGCTGCSPVGRTYSPSMSSSSRFVNCDGGNPSDIPLKCSACVNKTCTDTVTYVTGQIVQKSTFQGVLDTVEVGGVSGTAALGAIFNMTNRPHKLHRQRFLDTVLASGSSTSNPGLQDGVVGLAFRERSVLYAPNLVDVIVAGGSIHTPLFSLTLDASGGKLTLGGPGAFITNPITWLPLQKHGFWQPSVQAVGFESTKFPVAASAYSLAIVDTGTPTLNLPTPAWAAFKQRLLATCSTKHPLRGVCSQSADATIFNQSVCVALTPAELAMYPNLTFWVQGETGVEKLTIPPSRYMPANWYSCDTSKGQYPNRGLAVIEEAGWTVLGGPALIQYDSVFDMERLRVGFAVSA